MPATNLTDLFSDIADAIRGKDGTSNTIQASTFPARITAIPSSGGTIEITITGDISYLDYNGAWDNVLSHTDINVTINDATSAIYAFYHSKLTSLPSISFVNNTITNAEEMFCDARYFRYINGLSNVITGNGCRINGMFSSCYSLREVPLRIESGNSVARNYAYSRMFSECYVLNEIVDLGVCYGTTWTSNAFSASFGSCSRLRKLTFDTDNGTPYTTQWKSQTIDLSFWVGAVQGTDTNITGFNSGITTAKKVTDATSYAALKNDPDWYTLDVAYSRYNHDSAVETINSLPDTSAYIATAGGTNTIKFKGAAGSATDGGAINTLTAAEIAVATAKGWTVTYV